MNKKSKFIGSIGIIIISIILFIGGYLINLKKDKDYKDVFKDYSLEKTETLYKSDKSNNISTIVNKNKEQNNLNKEDNINQDIIKIDIKGAIKKPGVYTLNKGSRVEDVVKKSGGFLEEADKLKINLSRKLQDEELIYVCKKGENMPKYINEKLEDDSLLNTSNKKLNKKININTASLEELKTLPGIGEGRANSIIEFREKYGEFKSIEELRNISGIGEKTLDKFIHKVDIR